MAAPSTLITSGPSVDCIIGEIHDVEKRMGSLRSNLTGMKFDELTLILRSRLYSSAHVTHST